MNNNVESTTKKTKSAGFPVNKLCFIALVVFLLSFSFASADSWAFARSGYTAYKNITFITPAGTHQVDQEYAYDVRNGAVIGVNLSGITLARSDKDASKEIVCTTASNVTINKQILQNSTNVAGASWVILGININATSTGVNATCFYNNANANEVDSQITYLREDYETAAIGQNTVEWSYNSIFSNSCTFTATYNTSSECSWCGTKIVLMNGTGNAECYGSRSGAASMPTISTFPYSISYSIKDQQGRSLMTPHTGASTPYTTIIRHVYDQTGGNLSYYTGASYVDTGLSMVTNQWYNLTVISNKAQNMSMYINDAAAVDRMDLPADTSINNITFGPNYVNSYMGLDNLFITRGRLLNSTHKATISLSAEVTEAADSTPPSIYTQSPLNQTYTTNSIWFNITLNEAGNWAGHSLDGAANVTMANSSGNWNAQNTSMSQGSHNIRFYANDTSGNMNSSGIIYFTVDTISPALLSFTPSAGAVGIDTNTTISLTFSENMDQSTFSGVTMKDSGNNDVSLSLQSFSNATYTAIFRPSNLLNGNSAYTVTLAGLKDLAGNLLPNKSWSFTTATSYSINLSKSGANGWNLISLPVVPVNTDIESVLSNVINAIETVWTYNSISGNWSMYAPNDTSSDLSTMTAGYGYWINYNNSISNAINGSGNLIIEGASTPPQRTLISGWNLIGYYQRENTTSIASKCALFTLTPDINDETAKWWSMVFGYDNQNKQLTQVGYTGDMSPGQGYWAFMTSRLSTYMYGPGLSAGECI